MTHKSNSHLASFAVLSSMGQIAWFVSKDDAKDFINAIRGLGYGDSNYYSIEEVD